MDPLDRTDWTDFELAVAAVLDELEPGDVVTYGEVAAEAGRPGAARAVGSMLRRSSGAGFAWWRVVAADGRLASGEPAEQERRLTGEGVKVKRGRVVQRGTLTA